MDKATRNFIRNVNKSNQKVIEIIDAYTGKPVEQRYHWADDLKIKPSHAWIVISLVVFGIFALAVYNGY